MPTDTFSGEKIPKGTGLMYVKKDGTVYWFKNTKTQKNFLKLKRNPVKVKWTNAHHRDKEIKKKSKEAQ
ncbi:MAG: 50S ribosomal protein L24e [Candidatus Diapherotrites archaeon CG11_big_fil_rev_8_21_14_0_20_37_9]|nr:MAG: 50S ribosomal protein L24e [Candidatus Diapherotrites archaeon CG11_big_fil_rev_8_21_14_0_20_37_9]